MVFMVSLLTTHSSLKAGRLEASSTRTGGKLCVGPGVPNQIKILAIAGTRLDAELRGSKRLPISLCMN